MSELRLEIRAAEAAGRIGAELQGDGERVLGRPAPLESASLGAFSFVDPARGDEPAATGATGVLFVSRPIAAAAATQIVTPDPRGAFFGLVRSALAERERSRPGGIAASARVHPEARIAADATIDELVVVGARSSVGPGSWLRPGTVVGEDCRIGSGVVIHANVSIRSGTVIGDRVTIHDGSVIGADGFGYEPGPTGLVKVPQIGVVVIEDEAEIGANVCIDRAALGETRIGRGSKIDNLVQIAHNVQVGPHAVIVAQVGISGSTRLGRGVMIGGQAGLVGHLAIGDGVRIGAQSGVGEDLAAGSEVLGSPASDKRVALRSAMILPHLPAMRRQLRELDRRLDRLEDQSPDGRSRMP